MRRGIKQKFNTIKTMQDLQAYYQQQFSNFWAKSFPDKTCPPLPKKLEDVGLSVRLAMEEEAPELFQNLFRSDYSAMPADEKDGKICMMMILLVNKLFYVFANFSDRKSSAIRTIL